MKSEAAIQSEIRLEAGKRGILLWRNNNGACVDDRGQMVRYGLGNDSVAVGREIKSSDLIGIYNGSRMPDNDHPTGAATHSCPGRFLAIECKREDWKFPDAWRGKRPDHIERAELGADLSRTWAQWNFICAVRNAGGLAGFAQSVEDFDAILADNGAALEK